MASGNGKPVLPWFCKSEHLEFLDRLRNLDIIEMGNAGRMLAGAFDELSVDEAEQIVKYWNEYWSDPD